MSWKKTSTPIIHAYHEVVIPGSKRPFDWPDYHKVVGFCFPPTGFIPLERSLEEFVLAGDAPVYLGFGSMPAPDPRKLFTVAAQVVKILNVRVVVVTGWTELTDEMKKEVFGDDQRVLTVNGAPHDWLFPRCSAVVHHCGVGTTAAVLRAGVPSVGCPVYLDQPFWARRLHELGVAPKPLSFQKISTSLLVNALKAITPQMREKAKELAELINEDATAQAAALVEQVANSPPRFATF